MERLEAQKSWPDPGLSLTMTPFHRKDMQAAIVCYKTGPREETKEKNFLVAKVSLSEALSQTLAFLLRFSYSHKMF